jgi:hypothetical protein
MKSQYQLWSEKYKPLMGMGEPLNYMKALDHFSDMTSEQKDEYVQEKIDSNLFWTVIDIGGNRWSVRPGQHNGNVVAWWFCDVPYNEDVEEIEFD